MLCASAAMCSASFRAAHLGNLQRSWKTREARQELNGTPHRRPRSLGLCSTGQAPIAVYTSGKGSSAAGLTASVIRDAQSGEFYLEVCHSLAMAACFELAMPPAPRASSGRQAGQRLDSCHCSGRRPQIGGTPAKLGWTCNRLYLLGRLASRSLPPHRAAPWCWPTTAWCASTSLTRCARRTASPSTRCCHLNSLPARGGPAVCIDAFRRLHSQQRRAGGLSCLPQHAA